MNSEGFVLWCVYHFASKNHQVKLGDFLKRSGGENLTQIKPDFERLKIASEYIIGFSEWLKAEDMLYIIFYDKI